MRRSLLLVVILALSLTLPAAAAERRVGIISGFNMSELNIEGRGGEIRTSFAAGAVADFPMSEKFGIRVEPMFTSKGGKGTARNAYFGTVDGFTFQLDCIDIPVLARYSLGDADSRGYLLGGFGLAYFTEQKVDLSQGTNQETVQLDDVFGSTDLSLDLGIGIEFPAGPNRVTIDTRVGFGLININNGGTVDFNGAPLAVPSTATNTFDIRILASLLFPWPSKK